MPDVKARLRIYEQTISITAPREEIWRVLSDVAEWPVWLPTVSTVQPLDGDSLRIGARYVVRQPNLRPTTWVVTDLEEDVRFVWVALSPGLRMTAAHTIEEFQSGIFTVVLRFTFAGLLGGLTGWLFRSTTESYLAQEAASLKQRVAASR